jgi:hypothetical protein
MFVCVNRIARVINQPEKALLKMGTHFQSSPSDALVRVEVRSEQTEMHSANEQSLFFVRISLHGEIKVHVAWRKRCASFKREE